MANVCLVVLALEATMACERKPDLYACSTVIEREVSAPDGAHVAVVFHRECGATTDFNTQVGLRGRDEPLNPDGGRVVAIAGEHPLTPSWEAPNKLLIPLPDDRIYAQIARWKTIVIEYAPQGPAPSR